MPSTPVVTNQINNIASTTSAPDTVINLTNHFDDPFTTGLVATFTLSDPTLGGRITDTGGTSIVLYDQPGEGAPISVSNFLNYVEDGDYINTIIHRSVPGFVVQGGGFTVDGLADSLQDPSAAVADVPTDAPIQNEFSENRSNTRGTVAFARTNTVNSATSQWFFNLDDNSANLDNQNEGFTVFGEVLSETDLIPIDTIAGLPTSNQNNFFDQGAFTDLPLIADAADSPITSDADLVRYQNITVAQRDELTFSILGNTNPELVNASIGENNELVIDYLPGQVGTTDLTIQATNLQGVVVEDTFSVTVADPDIPVAQNDAVTTTQDTDAVIAVLDNDLAPEGEALSLVSFTQPSNGVVTDNGDGTLTYTPDPDFAGTETFAYTIQDESGDTSSADVDVTVTPAVPVAADDMVATLQDTEIEIEVLLNDQAPVGETLTVIDFTDPTSGTVVDNGDGTLIYTPNAGFIGTDSFTYTVEDLDGDEDTATVEVVVTAADQPDEPDVDQSDEPEADLNEDGQLDNQQVNVVSIASLNGAADNFDDILTLSAIDGTTFGNSVAVNVNPAPDAPNNPEADGVAFPVGYLDYQVSDLPGSTVTVRLQLPESTNGQAYNTYWNYGATPDNPEDHWYEFLYDGTTGAELIDTNNDGRADEVLLHFVDGQRGDSDLTENGVIEDPGAPGVSQATTTLVNDSNVLAVEGAGAAQLNFRLDTNNSAFVNQIGVVRVDAQNQINGLAPGDTGFTEAALQNGAVLFSAPQNGTDVAFLAGMELTRGLQFSAGDRILPYIITNGTAEQVLSGSGNADVFFGLTAANADNTEHVQVTNAPDEGTFTIAFEDMPGGGDQDFDDVVLTVNAGTVATPDQIVAARQGDPVGEFLDFTSPLFSDRDVTVNLTVTGEAGNANTFGFYRVEDTQGTVIDPLTGATLTPGSAGYSQAAQRLSVQTGDQRNGLRLTSDTTTSSATLAGGQFYAPFLIVDQSLPTGITDQLVYFAFGDASFDGFDHVQSFGDNTFGFEDQLFGGDQDFNDFVVQVEVAIA